MPIRRVDRFASTGASLEGGTAGPGVAPLALTRTRADPTPRKKWCGSSSSTGSAPNPCDREARRVYSSHLPIRAPATDAMKRAAAGPPAVVVRLAFRLWHEPGLFGFEQRHPARHSQTGLIVVHHCVTVTLPALPRLSRHFCGERKPFGSEGCQLARRSGIGS